MSVLLSGMDWAKQLVSVQEIVRGEPLDQVPQSFVCDVADDPCNPSIQVPLINMANLVNGESQEEELQKLYSACRDWGAFQLVNFGVSDELIKEVKKLTREFYNLPLQEKSRYAHKKDGLEGYGQAFSGSQKLQWSDMMFVNALPVEDRDLSFWPENPLGFREIIDSYSKEMRRLAVSLLGFMGMAMSLGAHEFSEVCEDGLLQVRMNYYPPCSQPEQVIGSSPHTDVTSITLLLEYDDTPGLQIRKDGCWVTSKPAHGAINVIIGHVIEIMSNGIYKPAEHRAVVSKSKERISIVSFCYPDKNATIQPAQDLVKPEYPAIYISLCQPEYFHRFFNQKGDVALFIDTLKIDSSSKNCA